MEDIEKIYIEPTSACNLNCSMCFRHGWIDEKVSSMDAQVVNAVLNIADSIPSVKQVMFSGMGEPLFHRDTVRMVKAFSETGAQVQLLTNGTLLTTQTSAALVDAGLSQLWISVDGFSRESYEKVHIGSRFDLITNNIQQFNRIRGTCKLGITFVIMQDNLSELPLINDFADQFQVDEINLSYAVPGAPVRIEDSCYDLPYAVGKQTRVIEKPAVEPMHDHCPFIAENACFIKWNGDVMPCMQLLHSSNTYLFEEQRSVYGKSFGNITVEDLRSIWEHSDYSGFRSRVRDFAFSDCTLCRGCDMRLDNKEDCMYNEFPTCGACLWAQGIARCP